MSSLGRTVRSRWRIRLTRRFFAVVDVTAPHISARLCAALWFRLPVPESPGHRHQLEPPGGSAFELRGNGLTIRGRVYGDSGPTAYLVHGWGGHWQQLAAHIEPLRAVGYRVVVYDAPSHGDSAAGAHGPRSSRVMEMALAHAMVVERYGAASLTVAHSLGTMAVLWAMHQHGTGSRSLVAVAPATDMDELVDAFRRMTGLGVRSRAEVIDHIERTTRLPHTLFTGQVLVRGALAAHGVVPLLAIHDISDTEASSRMATQLVDGWPGATLVQTEGLGHRRVLRDPAVVARVAQFAAEQAAPPVVTRPLRSASMEPPDKEAPSSRGSADDAVGRA